MNLKDIFLTASANMLRSKLRTFLTVLAIFVGAFTLTITSGIGSGISDYINRQLGNLGAADVLLVQGIGPRGPNTGSTDPKKYDPARKTTAGFGPNDQQVLLTDTDIAKVSSHHGVVSVAPIRSISADYIAGASGVKYQVSISPNIRGTKLDLASGGNLNDTTSAYQVIIPINYVVSLGFTNASTAIGKTVTIGLANALGNELEQTAMIVGVQQNGIIGGGNAVINSSLTNQLYNLQTQGLPDAIKHQYQLLQAKIDPKLSIDQLTTLKDDLKKQGYLAQTVQDKIGTFKTVIGAVIYVLDAFAIIALLAASFGIINTLLMSVQERTKEIGLMKAMGMSGWRIFLLFSIEATLIGFWGSLVGIGVAFGVGRAADTILSHGFLKDLPGLAVVAFPLQSVLVIMLIIMTIAFLAGTLPARKASKQNPIEALRYE